MKTIKILILPALLTCFIALVSAKDAGKETERIQKSTTVIHDFSKMKESIPSQLIQEAHGMIIIPHMINAGLAVGGKRGKGVAIVKMADGKWSNPVFVTFTGGSLGLQIGVQSVDLVLVFKHKDVLTKMQNGDFTIGGDISVAAGPVGRSGTASTDYKLEAEVYSYSRSKGLFAGLSINGSNISVDKSANANFYGGKATSQSIFADATSSSADVNELKAAIAGL
ncbi:lipid-binding SYLF domain-containing protein [Mucilaginibacter mali]|uniref:Lipid-binding SYLF domain-containing protein n=1 Tax=Mucilaginibacter mali TaxID=2740462 RepID=A0A7D4QPL9_9SPHI|nr:lipid-binding SYLF domain-containing protein [Mucilaginibacter mali]QKJ28669.1 lipid-binding SYLF domain-containing protein [Mucilaginibacter mali]